MDHGQSSPGHCFWWLVCFFLLSYTVANALTEAQKAKQKEELAQNMRKLTQALKALGGEDEDDLSGMKALKPLKFKNKWTQPQKKQFDTAWDKMPIKKRAEYLIKEFDLKAEGQPLHMPEAELRTKYVETATFLGIDAASTIIKGARTAVGIKDIPLEDFAWIVVLGLKSIEILTSKAYIARIDNLDKVVACIDIDDKKRAKARIDNVSCSSIHCVAMSDCIAVLLSDVQYLLMPLFSVIISGAQIGDKRIHGAFPLVFQIFAPKAQITAVIKDVADMIFLFMQLLRQVTEMLELNKTPSSVTSK